MRKIAVFSTISTVLLALLVFPAPAHAQDAPKFEFAVGYQYLHDNNSSQDLPKGWMLSAGADLASWFSLIGEISGSSKTLASVNATDVNLSEYTYLGGPKFTVTSNAPVAPFVQVLFGVAHGSLSVGRSSSNLSVSGNQFAVQPGAGLDFNPSPQIGRAHV